jgi:hypothetical protein
VGPSSSGKTSVIRALVSLLTNTSEAKEFIKHGESKTEVSLELGSLPKIKWSRTIKESNYLINDISHQKVGKADLFDLTKVTGFCKDDDDNILNIQDEWSPLFPFGRSGYELYKLFEGTFKINVSSIILDRIKTDESECKKSISGLNNKVVRNLEKIDKIVELKKHISLKESLEDKDTLIRVAEQTNKLNSDTELLIKDLKVLSKFRDISTIDSKGDFFDNYKDIIKDVTYLENNLTLLNFQDNLLEDNLDLFNETLIINKDLLYIEANLDLISFEETSIDTDLNIINNYLGIDKDTQDMLIYIKEYKELTTEHKLLKDELINLEKLYSEIEVCPLCNQEIKGD